GRGAADRAPAARAEGDAAGATRLRAGRTQAPAGTGAVQDRRGGGERLPGGAGPARVHGDLDAEARRERDRERRERFLARLLRPRGVPRAEPAVLPADDGRGLRALLRDGPRVP